MPLYQYECAKCKKNTELMHGMNDTSDKKCETCGTKLERVMGSTSFQLKGSGWYETDYKNKKSGSACGHACDSGCCSK